MQVTAVMSHRGVSYPRSGCAVQMAMSQSRREVFVRANTRAATAVLQLVMLVSLLTVSMNANAFFFLFVPITKKAQAGDMCFPTTAKVGDVQTSANGATITIISISGTSSLCKDSARPILVKTKYTESTTFSSKAGLDLPEGYTPNALNEVQEFNGVLLLATNKSNDSYVTVSAVRGEIISDFDHYAENLRARAGKNLNNTKVGDLQKLTINGLPARQYTYSGDLKNLYGTNYTFLVTALQGSDEVVLVESWCPTKKYEKNSPEFIHISQSIVGIAGNPNAPVDAQKAGEGTANQKASDSGHLPNGASTGNTPLSASNSEERLKQLNDLLKQGLINQTEYDAKKAEILKSL